jgi:hypothetical protein
MSFNYVSSEVSLLVKIMTLQWTGNYVATGEKDLLFFLEKTHRNRVLATASHRSTNKKTKILIT